MPDRRRQRYGDIDYDWEYRVNTTAAAVSWRTRLLGLLHSAYQPVEPELFRKMMAELDIDFSQFNFVDIGSGKGRALLLAAEYPFQRIIGVELLPELHRVAEENVRRINVRRGGRIETRCEDATEFEFPAVPLVVYLFHPLPEAGFHRLMDKLRSSLQEHPRPVRLTYVNPIFEGLVGRSGLHKVAGSHQYALFRE